MHVMSVIACNKLYLSMQKLSVYRLDENKTDWFRSQGPRFYSSFRF